MVIKFINSNELLENLILVTNLKRLSSVLKCWIYLGCHAIVFMPGLKPNHGL